MHTYRCKNCLWEGMVEEMVSEGEELLCPQCCAYFSDSPIWEVAHINEDPEGMDYGDF